MIGSLVVAATVTVFAALQAFFWHKRSRQLEIASLLRKRLGIDEVARSLLQRVKAENADRLELLLQRSGLGWTKVDFVRRLTVASVILGVFGAWLGGFSGAIIWSMIGVAGSYGYLVRAKRQRIEKVNAQMPRALEIMILALRAGHALPRAVDLVAAEVPAPTGSELKRVADEHALGRPLEEAFVAMGERLEGCDAVRTMVTSILVLRQTGGNLIEVLERVIETLSAQTQYRLRLKAMTAESRYSGVMLMALPGVFAVFIQFANPSYFQLFFVDPMGQLIGGLTLLLWGVGAVWMQRLAQG